MWQISLKVFSELYQSAVRTNKRFFLCRERKICCRGSNLPVYLVKYHRQVRAVRMPDAQMQGSNENNPFDLFSIKGDTCHTFPINGRLSSMVSLNSLTVRKLVLGRWRCRFRGIKCKIKKRMRFSRQGMFRYIFLFETIICSSVLKLQIQGQCCQVHL